MIRRLRSWCAGAGDDAGSVTVFVVGIAMVLVVLAGLVVDGGNRINGQLAMEDDAEQAARAGATVIDQTALREDGVVRLKLGPGGAAAQAEAYMRELGYGSNGGTLNATVLPDGQTIHIDATRIQQTQLLGLIGKSSFTLDAHAQARAVTGIG